LAQPAIAAAAEQAGALAAQDFQTTVSLVSGVEVTTLQHDKMAMPWLRQPLDGVAMTPGLQPVSPALRRDYTALVRFDPLAPSHTALLGQLAAANPMPAAKVISPSHVVFHPVPSYYFCIPPSSDML